MLSDAVYAWKWVMFTRHLWWVIWTNICIPMCSCVCCFSVGLGMEMGLDVRVGESYLFEMRNGSLPPVKLELLVNVVLQALTHAALLVCRIGFQAEQAVTLLQKKTERERGEQKKRRWGEEAKDSGQLSFYCQRNKDKAACPDAWGENGFRWRVNEAKRMTNWKKTCYK